MATISTTLSSKEASSTHDVTLLIKTQGGATLFPSDDQVLTLLHQRFRSDLPYTRLSSSTLLVVNPLKTLANLNDASARDYQESEYVDTTGDEPPGGPMQPHLYELAARVYLLMRRRKESQAVVFSGITGSGKSFSSELFLSQILRLSSHSRKESRISDQVKALSTLLDSFGSAKTSSNPSASRFGKLLELHFTEKGRISGAKVLTFGLDKSRVTHLASDERSFNVFYQLLAGASPDERDALNLEEPSSYALLASSGCYLLPGGPTSDDHAQMGELRAAMAALGFKPKHVASIFSLLVAILLLGNLEFIEHPDRDLSYESAIVGNLLVLDEIARLLGVEAEDLEQALTNKTKFIRKELASGFLTAEGSAVHRDGLVRDLYAILFAFVVESANQKLDSDETPPTQISLFDQPGFQSRTPSGSMQATGQAPLIAAFGQNSLEELCFNFSAEILHSQFVRRTFDDSMGYNASITADRVPLPSILTMENSGCVELLRGGPIGSKADRKPAGIFGALAKGCSRFKQGKSSDDKDEELLDDLTHKFGAHGSFITSPGVGNGPALDRTLFGINHYTGSCSYDVRGFIEKDLDVLDASFVGLLRGSTDSFINKLVSGPSIAAELHPQDNKTLVQAQVSITPLRRPTVVNPSPTSTNRSPPPEPFESPLEAGELYPVTTQLNSTLAELLRSIESSRTWDVLCLRPNDNSLPNSFDKRRVKSQIRAFLLPDMVARRRTDFVADLELGDFASRYSVKGDGSIETVVSEFATSRSWTEGLDYFVGDRRIWLSYDAWKEVEDEVRDDEKRRGDPAALEDAETIEPVSMMAGLRSPSTPWNVGAGAAGESAEDLLVQRQTANGSGYFEPAPGNGFAGYAADLRPNNNRTSKKGGYAPSWVEPEVWENNNNNNNNNGRPDSPATFVSSHGGGGGDARSTKEEGGAGAGGPGDGLVVKEMTPGATVETIEISSSRKWWVRFVWLMTWWIPNFLLSKVGRMKRPDVRMAWREKVTICFLIFLLCAIVIFYVVIFGRLLCPKFNYAWNTSELSEHAAENDFWVSVAGRVYDITDFWRAQHSDIAAAPVTSDVMLQLAGLDLTGYFPIPFNVACPGLVTDETLALQRNFTAIDAYAVHWSGEQQTQGSTGLLDANWYPNTFLPFLKPFYKGEFVIDNKLIVDSANDGSNVWAVYKEGVYDLTDYFTTVTFYAADTTVADTYSFLDSSITDVFQNFPGQDITKALDNAFAALGDESASQQLTCLKNAFYKGEKDFRTSPRCTANNYILLAFSVLIMVTILAKFLAALQLTSKRTPELQDKFVICQIPCYTEGEESLRRTLDSLAALKYDDKRKLMFVLCDGNIIGSGNDRTTPRIVLDILGVDPKLDPEPLLFKSVGEGSKQLNYGKVYSGLYEFEGHVVPYMVIVKVGKPSERSKPGNRGKRDSQVLLLRYLNRVHFDAPMAPLELEIYHQMRNVIGIDPAFYEYLFQIDADTSVDPDSLNRMVACAVDDQSIIGICGETKLQNEMQSITTMIQVYEYFISHHLAKAFESLFGSVTCLPGCFSVYRIRTADKGRPIIISQRIIDDYSEPVVDTLHKKNLFSLGEDRYLTTLMLKYFPAYKMKFTPDAISYTVAPDRWSVLLSQRRRWINSTIHNLAELYFLPDLCGFCLFSMRFIVFLDLVGTIILPATCVYLFYLIITVATGQAPIPTIALIMIGVSYGLQVIIFLLKREFMLIGWMVIFLLAYPIYSFFLPVYSFWSMDDFSWGNTRVVVGEGKEKTVITSEGEYFDDSMIPLKKFSDYEAEAWENTSRQESGSVKGGSDYGSTRASVREQKRQRSPLPPPSFGGGFNGGSQYGGSQGGGDFYRDSNALKHHNSNPNIGQHNNLQNSRMPSMASIGGFSGYGNAPPYNPAPPSLPQMGFTSSPHASEYSQPLYPPSFPGMGVQRNTMMSLPSAYGGAGLGGGVNNPRMSTFSLATTANPFASNPPSESTDPSDEEVLSELRHYLSSQDLMTVTKKTARVALFARFPKADLTGRVPWINQSIDGILQGSL